MEKGKGDDNIPSISEAEPTTTRASTSDDRRAGIVHKEFEASSDIGNSLKGQVSLVSISCMAEKLEISTFPYSNLENLSYTLTEYYSIDIFRWF